MPRNLHTGAPSRPRARITQKTRLRIVQGDEHEADVLFIPDEDEEKNRLTNLVAGVDAEDANEHHLQAVLSAHSHQSPAASRSTRGAVAGEKTRQNVQPAAFIPTPDSTGIVDNYKDLYPSERWKDPVSYLSTSTTVEESCTGALSEGFSYYMDERDKEWLDKNNEEARGEGTSAQGSLSSTTRTSSRSAKGKGKEPEQSQLLVITEDELELVMGLYEKVTHEKTEYLHHGLENGMTFPSFQEYQESFSNPLPAPTFESYTVPSWIPPPQRLLALARTIYPYWKERRLERGGHRIIPTLNFDESDTLNESYICFRRREIKAVRKTRAQQAPASDKLIRLQAELAYPLELAKTLLDRENRKKEATQGSQQVWDKRMGLVDLKRKYPSLGERGDEELLVDKEKPKKAETVRPAKVRPEAGAPLRVVEVAIRPSERASLINESIENALARQKERDHHWEDQVDNPYQTPLVPIANRLFKYIPVNFQASETDGRPILEGRRQPRAIRTRVGRGGRVMVDRRDSRPRPVLSAGRSSLFASNNDDDDVMADTEDEDRTNRVAARWRFDDDDSPATGPEGSDEQNRVLVDDYSPRLLSRMMTFMGEMDQQNLVTDPSIPIIHEGHQRMVLPYRLGMNPAQLRRAPQRPSVPIPKGYPQPGQPGAKPPTVNGTPVSVPQQLKMPPPPAPVMPQMRISSNGGMRPPSTVSPNVQGTPVPQPPTPPTAMATPIPHAVSTNGFSRAAMNMPHVMAATPSPDVTMSVVQSATNGLAQCPGDPSQANELKAAALSAAVANNNIAATASVNGTPIQHQQQLGMVTPTNGFHLTSALANAGHYYANAGGAIGTLSAQQVKDLKSTFAAMGNPPSYMQVQVPGPAGPRSSVFSS
ncbi:hypothetical protein H0H92_002506 [Tricholoma furcatifolium]|nr:hypothetical protein H0H92_002506 [Tricholoma furcatifolium]